MSAPKGWRRADREVGEEEFEGGGSWMDERKVGIDGNRGLWRLGVGFTGAEDEVGGYGWEKVEVGANSLTFRKCCALRL